MSLPRSGSWLVRCLLRLYPRDFRRRYGDEILWAYGQIRRERTRNLPATTGSLVWGAVRLRISSPHRSLKLKSSHDEGGLMNALRQDFHYAFRMLARNPLFAVVSVLTLAVGIGATTASFHLIESYFLAPPMTGPGGELVRLYQEQSRSSFRFGTFSYPTFQELQARTEVFSRMAAHRRVTASVELGGVDEAVEVELVTSDYFPLFGAGVTVGRTLSSEDNLNQGAHPVVVISNRFWQTALGGDREVVGRSLRLNGFPFTVAGVAAAGFRGAHPGLRTDIWAPITMHNQVRPTGLDLHRQGWGWLTATASVRPGVAAGQVGADLDRVSAQLRVEFPSALDDGDAFAAHPATPLPDELRDGFGQIVGVMSAVVVLILLVGCTNIAGILMGRVVGRRREMAIRLSLGSGRLRLTRLWICEALILSLTGGAVGMLVAVGTHHFLVSMVSVPSLMPAVAQSFTWGGSIVGFTVAVSLAAGCLFGLVPALQAGRVDIVDTIKQEAGTTTGSWSGSRLRASFVATQVAVSVLLLVSSGLLLRSLRQADSFNPGFDTADILLAPVNLGAIGYDAGRSRQFADRLRDRLSAYSGVRSVGYALSVPLSGDQDTMGFVIPGYPTSDDRPFVSIPFNVVSPGYFEALGLPVVRGRGFADHAPRDLGEVVVNEAAAAHFWPGRDPVGQRFAPAGQPGRPLEVVGVAANVNYRSLGERPHPFLYTRADQVPLTSFVIHVKTAGGPAAFLPDLKKEIAALEPSLPIRGAMSFAEMRRIPLLPQQLMARLTLVFASMALLLTAIGIYGVVAQSVAARTQEIGVRMAFGGSRPDIVRMILTRVVILVGAGTLIGLAGAGIILQLMDSLLFGVSATDPLTYGAVALMMALVALGASLQPLRRATSVNPVKALRYE